MLSWVENEKSFITSGPERVANVMTELFAQEASLSISPILFKTSSIKQ